jgi:DNA polymerase kappa
LVSTNSRRTLLLEVTGGLTLSAGIGPNFMIAKVAADVRKPDGQTLIGSAPSVVAAFLEELPCRKVRWLE